MVDRVPRVFVSYSSDDLDEVEQLHSELARRGVVPWRDKTDLPKGRVSADQIEKAARSAAGFVFYLTRAAAESRWVREDERRYALQNQGLDESFGIFPVFRDDRKQVTKRMQELAEDRADLAAYDLQGFNGYILRLGRGRSLASELTGAATGVLESLLDTIRDAGPPGKVLRLGAATRGGPSLPEHDLDLRIDWTEDFPGDQGAGGYPNATVAGDLLTALQDLRTAICSRWPGRTIRLLPHCHLSMAFALGFLFRRNSGFTLEVGRPQDPLQEPICTGPAVPLLAASDFWSIEATEPGTAGPEGVAAVVGVSRSIEKPAGKALDRLGVRVARRVVLEPAGGPSFESMSGLTGDQAHRAARALADTLGEERSRGVGGPIHLFYAGPATFAVLLAQQLSNLGLIQTYEWKGAEERFVPVFELRSA